MRIVHGGFWLTFAAFVACVLPSPTLAAGSGGTRTARVDAATYRRAEAILPQNISDLVRQISVRPHWIGETSEFWFERELPSGVEYVRVNAATGETRPLLDHSGLLTLLAQATGEAHDRAARRLEDLDFNEKKNEFRFGFAHRHWLYDGSSRQLVEEPTDRERSVESPDGAWRAVVRNGDLYVIASQGGRELRLTRDGTPDQPYARPVVNVRTMVAQGTTTPSFQPDVYWSPDSRRVATYRVDFRGARRLALVQSTPPNGAPPRVFDYAYTLTGDETPPTARGMIFDIPSGRRTDMRLPPEPILYYDGLEFEWNAAGDAVFLRSPERGYHSLRLFRINAASGETSLLTESRSDTYVDYYGHHWSFQRQLNINYWTADDTGFAHVYAIEGTSGERRQLTSGDWRARAVLGTDVQGRAALVVGSGREAGRDPYLRSLYRVPLGGGAPLPLTPEPLDHDASVSPDGLFFVDNMSLINVPTRSVLRRSSDGAVIMELGRADISAFQAAGYRLPEPFETRAADGVTPIYGAIFRPSRFDPRHRYPVIENIYTGPHYVMTPKSFEAALSGRNAASVAELGFVVVTIDGRGTWGRSRAFQQPAYRNLHDVGLDDHIAGLRQVAARNRYMDLSRVGIYGFSAGGYDVVRAMTRHPEFYRVGVSASGNHDNRLDKAQWNEQWMGSQLGPIFDENSNVHWADRLAGRLLLAHGEVDENVPPAATLRLVNALMNANRDFDFLMVPNAGHFLDDNPYFQRRRWDFFVRELLNAEPPTGYRIADFD